MPRAAEGPRAADQHSFVFQGGRSLDLQSSDGRGRSCLHQLEAHGLVRLVSSPSGCVPTPSSAS